MKLNEIYCIEKRISSGWSATAANANPFEWHLLGEHARWTTVTAAFTFSDGNCRTRITIRIGLNEIWCANKITIIHSRSTRWISLKHNKYILSAAISMRNRYHRIRTYRVSQWGVSVIRENDLLKEPKRKKKIVSLSLACPIERESRILVWMFGNEKIFLYSDGTPRVCLHCILSHGNNDK